MTKWKAHTATANIGTLELGDITFDEDSMDVSIDIQDMSDNLKAEINKAIEICKVESVEKWNQLYDEYPQLKRFNRVWSSKPAIIDYTYLRVILESGRAVTYSIEARFHDADNEMLEEWVSVEVDLSAYTNELKKMIIKGLVDKFF